LVTGRHANDARIMVSVGFMHFVMSEYGVISEYGSIWTNSTKKAFHK